MIMRIRVTKRARVITKVRLITRIGVIMSVTGGELDDGGRETRGRA